MARTNKRNTASSNLPKVEKVPEKKRNLTAAELHSLLDSAQSDEQKKIIADFEKRLANFEQATDAKLLKDITKTQTRAISTFNKENLRNYLLNIGSNEKNLRDLSWYLYYRSMTYMRLCNFYGNLLELDCRSVIPEMDLVKGGDANKMQKSFNETLKVIDIWHLQKEFRDMALIAMIQDVFGGIWIEDDTGLFIWQIPAQYVRITGKYMTGDFSLAMDMTYIRSHQELLEYMPDPLQSMYNEYESTRQKWVLVPDEYAVCIKFRSEDPDSILPPFVPLFNAIINLSDLEDAQAMADALSVYKLIWLEMETLSGTNMPDDWKIDPEIMAEYFVRMINEALPEYVSAALVPGKLNTISFEDQADNDTTKVLKATETLLNTAGGAEILNGVTISGAEALRIAQIVNSNFILKPLLPQVEAIVNRHLTYTLGNPSHVKFHYVSSLTKDKFKEDVLTAAQNGYPAKFMIGSAFGLSEKQTMTLNFLEEQIFGLTELFTPLRTSYTQSDEGGRPKQSASDTGDESADKRDRSRG